MIQGACGDQRYRWTGMVSLIVMVIRVAFVFSWIVQLGVIGEDALLWELATLVTIMLLGHWIEMRSIQRAEGALAELAKLLPDTATRVLDGADAQVPIAALRPGDMVLVRPGESVPADGLGRQVEAQLYA